jgi:hypothetical protein
MKALIQRFIQWASDNQPVFWLTVALIISLLVFLWHLLVFLWHLIAGSL